MPSLITPNNSRSSFRRRKTTKKALQSKAEEEGFKKTHYCATSLRSSE
jgi:hypothetical protein